MSAAFTRFLICGPAPCSEQIRDEVKLKLRELAMKDIEDYCKANDLIPPRSGRINFKFQELSKDASVEEWHVGVII